MREVKQRVADELLGKVRDAIIGTVEIERDTITGTVKTDKTGKAKSVIVLPDPDFFRRMARAVKHYETLKRQPVDRRRNAFLCFASQHLCHDGIAGNVTGIIHANKTRSDVKRHFRQDLKRPEPSEQELTRWQHDCGVILAHDKPGTKPGSKKMTR